MNYLYFCGLFETLRIPTYLPGKERMDGDRDINRRVSALNPVGFGVRYGSIMRRKSGSEMLSRGAFGAVIGKLNLPDCVCVCFVGFF
ncbi:hypothetical protein [Coprobacter fastidiosus]|uniref:hypothetical protein n=1 Tax=Coprobacter fastidiosus TaxID=1099853 RepID=UPI00266FF90A|nr:hypothetical protein [Coprobacter fastidiosus]